MSFERSRRMALNLILAALAERAATDVELSLARDE
jgi:hypothetical protein